MSADKVTCKFERDLAAAGAVGKAYLREVQAVAAEPGFRAFLEEAAKDKVGDLHLARAAAKALAGDEDAALNCAESLLQVRLQPKVHRLHEPARWAKREE